VDNFLQNVDKPVDNSKYIVITAYLRYQTHHDRDMKWFKWRTDCLQSYDFMSLSPAQRWLFIGLMCVATKSQNGIKYDIPYLTNTLKVRRIDKLMAGLLERGMIQIVPKSEIQIREDKIREEKKREEVRKEIKDSLTRG